MRTTKIFLMLALLCAVAQGAWADEVNIGTADEWQTFVTNVNNGTTYSGSTVKLTADISVSEMVGASETNSFQGTFDGDGHTLTVSYNTTAENTAPFRFTKNATIKNLHTSGNIQTSAKFAGGIVAESYGSLTIEDCRSSVNINSSVSGDGTHGGLVARLNGTDNTIKISGCVFDGSFATTNGTTNCGGFIGWPVSNAPTIENSLMKPTSVAEGMLANAFTRVNKTPVITNCYYLPTTNLPTGQGTEAYATVPADNICKQLTFVGSQQCYVPCTVGGVERYYRYTGSAISVTPTVTFQGTTLTEGTNYDCATSPATVQEAGDYTLTVTGKGDYTGSQSVSFFVSNTTAGMGSVQYARGDLNGDGHVDMADVTVLTEYLHSGAHNLGEVPTVVNDWAVSVGGTYTFTGSAIVPDAANITVHSTSMDDDVDAACYNVLAGNNVNAGEATLIVCGTGVFGGVLAYTTFTIAKAEASIGYATPTLTKNVQSKDFIYALTYTGDGIVSYTSSNPAVATVNSTTGEVDILTTGTTRITATIADSENYTYPSNTAYYDLTITEAATISELKTLINNGTDCTSFLGYQVNADGDINNTVTNPIGYIAYVSTTDVDTSISGSRILVLAASNDTDEQWEKGATHTKSGIYSESGYSNTNTLQSSSHLAAYYAWNHSAAIPANGSTPAHWFLPSKPQLDNCLTALGGWTSWLPSYTYWSSNEDPDDYDNAYTNYGSASKDNYKKVRACFAY